MGWNEVALSHFTAEPGRVYYFRARSYSTETDLTALDSDEGQFLTGRYSYSTSRTKK